MITVDQARDLAARYFARRSRFVDEDEETSLLVVLLNFGDHLTAVSCIGGEWSGTKGELRPGNGIPVCPLGHPLLESDNQVRLALVRQVSAS